MSPISASSSDGRPKTGLRRALGHVNGLWFPVNSELLERVKSGLKSGAYELDIDFLINDLKGDFALFTYCLRGLSKLLQETPSGSCQGDLSIRQLFKVAGTRGIAKILSVEASQISRHLPATSSRTQVERLEAAIISASTAEVLSERQGIDPLDGYSTALLRQLGLTLLAFNYPTAFRRALSMDGKSIDEGITEQLGFSPATLGGAILHDWKYLQGSIRFAAGGIQALTPEEATRVSEIEGPANALARLCEIGEALTRAAHPQHYPTAVHDWHTAKATIDQFLGHEGVHLIAERTRENIKQYVALFPGLMSLAQHFAPEARLHEFQRESISQRNPHVAECLAPLRAALFEFYEQLGKRTDIRENLHQLVHKVIPVSGFSGGAIYTLDPTTRTLGPRFRFGRIELHSLTPISLDRIVTTRDPIALAYDYNAPLCEEETMRAEHAIMAGSLGGARGVGVVYVEYPLTVFRDLHGGATVHFKALRHAIHDALGLIMKGDVS